VPPNEGQEQVTPLRRKATVTVVDPKKTSRGGGKNLTKSGPHKGDSQKAEITVKQGKRKDLREKTSDLLRRKGNYSGRQKKREPRPAKTLDQSKNTTTTQTRNQKARLPALDQGVRGETERVEIRKGTKLPSLRSL